MKKLLLFTALSILLFSCSSDDDGDNLNCQCVELTDGPEGTKPFQLCGDEIGTIFTSSQLPSSERQERFNACNN